MAKPPRQQWRTVPYIEASGRCDVLDYLENLKAKNLRSWQHFQNIRSQVIERGPFAVGPPYWEGLGDGVYEVSWGRHRIYCTIEPEKRVVMYVAVLKRWRVFRNSDRALCEARRVDFLSPDYDEEQRALLYKARCQRRGKNGSV